MTFVSHCREFTTQNIKLSIKDFRSKYGQIRGKLRIWSHLLKKPLIENFTFYVLVVSIEQV